MGDHLSNESILALAANALPDTETVRVHLAGCDDCRRRLEVARHEQPPEPRLSPTLANAQARAPILHSAPQLGRYRVLRELGRGAMGVVLLAEDSLLGRQVALKAVGPAVDGQLSAHVTAEARAIARLQHPNVVGLYDVLQHDGQAYLAMEYVEGEDLADWMKGPSTARQRLELFVQVARGLVAAHGAAVVHRDFKPANVLVGNDGRARVSDFGLATMQGEHDAMQRGSVVGTPAYMAPEQFAGKLVTAAADQFAFCASLFEALTGSRPYTGDDLEALRASVQKGPPVMPAAVPAKVAGLLTRGLAVEPLARFSSMQELLNALELALEQPKPVGRLAVALGVTLFAVVGVAGIARVREAPCRLENTRVGALEATVATVKSPALRDSLSATLKNWAQSFETQCNAPHTDAEWTRNNGCLEAILDDVESVCGASELVEVGKPVESLLQYVGQPHACANPANPLRAALPTEPGQRRRVNEALAALVDATDFDNKSDRGAQRVRTEFAVEAGLGSGHSQTHARALLARARLEYNENRPLDFLRTVERARTAALAGSAHRELANAMLMQGFDVCIEGKVDDCARLLSATQPLIDILEDPWLRLIHRQYQLDEGADRWRPEAWRPVVEAWKALPGADQELARAQQRTARALFNDKRDQEALAYVDELLPRTAPLSSMKALTLALLRAQIFGYLGRPEEALELLRAVRAAAERLKLPAARADSVLFELDLLNNESRPAEMLALLSREERSLDTERYHLRALRNLGRFDELATLLSHLDFPLVARDLQSEMKLEIAEARVLSALVQRDKAVLSRAGELLGADLEASLNVATLTTLGREAEALDALRRGAKGSYMLEVELAMRERRWADAARVLDAHTETVSRTGRLELELRRAACGAMLEPNPALSCARYKELFERMRSSSWFSLYPNEVDRIAADLKPKCH